MTRLALAPFVLLASLPLGAQDPDVAGPTAVLDAPNSAAATVEAAVECLRKQEFGAVWQMLPESYRGDVKGLVTSLSKKVDAEAYGTMMKTAGGVARLVRDKKAMIADLIQQQMGAAGGDDDGAELVKTIDGMATVLGVLTNSKHIASTEALGVLDVGAFANEIGRSVVPFMLQSAKTSPSPDAKQMLAFFSGDQKIEVRETSGDDTSAVLELSFGDETEEFRMTKVEGRWLPEELVAEWADQMAEAKQSIDEMEPMSAQAKAQVGQMTAMVDQLVGQLTECESSEEMQETLMRNPLFAMMQSVMGGR